MNDTQLYTKNMQVIHNEHIFKKYFPNIWYLAYNSNIRIAEREIENTEISFEEVEEQVLSIA